MIEDAAATAKERDLLGLAFHFAPRIAAALAFAAGAVTIVAVASPSLPHIAGLEFLDRFVAEFPELSASAAGVTLIVLAGGLWRRIDTAWAMACALLAALSAYALLRHEHVLGGASAGAAALVLLLLRPAFYRHSPLSQLAPGRIAALAVAVALGAGLVAGLLWAGGRPGFAAAPWWALILDPHLGRPGRVIGAGAATFAALSVAGFITGRARGRPIAPTPEDFTRVETIMAHAERARPDMHLALSGDKAFLFTPNAFVMTARGGGSLIAMGAPVGARRDWPEALNLLRREAERLALRPVVYAAPPELLPDLLDAGFRVDKVGENGLVDLKRFNLDGPSKRNLRTARRRFAEREGAVFEVRPAPHAPAFIETLRPVSDAWLAAHGGQEKAFSLGRFDADYLSRHVLAIVRKHGKPIAFCNIWTTPDRAHAAVDLMRHHPNEAPNGIMDFLFTESILWAQIEKFGDFDLGMAPLAGLSEAEYAPLFAKLGRMVFARGEPFYGFQGLRKYKEKFSPDWEPRYLAAPGAWSMPIVLAEVGLLTSGGLSGLLTKPSGA